MLQRQVDDLDQLKSRHYEEIIEHEEEVWDVVQGKVTSQPPLHLVTSNTHRITGFPRGPFIPGRL